VGGTVSKCVIIVMVKGGHVIRLEETRNIYEVLVGICMGRAHLGDQMGG
jgi:hypothetical protein